jgi:short-subunit dehydrogenase
VYLDFRPAGKTEGDAMATRSILGMRTILTGTSSGIGLALARLLAKRGARLVLSARREERLTKLVDELKQSGGEAIAVAGDITADEVRRKLMETAKRELGGLDCLINNAGIGGIGNFIDNDEARLRRIMEVNFFAPLELTRLAIPELRQGSKPILVNVASVLGHRAVPKKSEYCASKFALHGFSDSLRSELAPEHIDVLIVSPSTTETEFFDVAIGDKRKLPWLAKGQPPETVARAAVRAIERGLHEIILTAGGKGMVWFDRLMPTITDNLVTKYG